MATFNYHQYTKFDPEPEPYNEGYNNHNDYEGYDYNNNYYYEENYYTYYGERGDCEEDYYNYKTALQNLHTTLSTTLTFLTHLLHSFNNDIQNLTYVSDDTIDQLWRAKITTTTTASWDSNNQDNTTHRENRGICFWIRKLRAFFTPDDNDNHSHNPTNNHNKAKEKGIMEHLSRLETDLVRVITTPWPPQGTVYGPDSVVYSDLSLDSLHDRLVITLECFPVSMEYRRVKEVVMALELVQIVMDRTCFLWSLPLSTG